MSGDGTDNFGVIRLGFGLSKKGSESTVGD